MKYLRATLASSQASYSDGVEKLLPFDETEESNNMSLSTGRYTCNNPFGELIYYSCLVDLKDITVDVEASLRLKKNGSNFETVNYADFNSTNLQTTLPMRLEGIIKLLNTDYIEFYTELDLIGGSLTGISFGTNTETDCRLILCEIPTASGNVVGAA